MQNLLLSIFPIKALKLLFSDCLSYSSFWLVLDSVHGDGDRRNFSLPMSFRLNIIPGALVYVKIGDSKAC
ncbi:MAG TPA: hypothetical protein VJ249_10740 [Candidatus Bathyarchaeia archaeon]|nr:hypothetical protein [Candidatus Bathyarchaeia archaeon]